MKKGYLLITIFALNLAWFTPLPAEGNDLGLEVGLGVGAALGQNESEENEFKPHLRATLGTTWSEHYQTELGVSLAQNGDGEFETNLIPIDVRMRISPIASETIKPFFYLGFGALYYEVTTVPENAPPNKDIADWTAIIPFGLGLQYYFSEDLSLDVCGGEYFSFSDLLNPLNGDDDDSFLAFTVGLKYALASGNRDPDGDGLVNKDEKQIGTDKHNPDTDGDGLWDGEEVNQYLTNPLAPDSDNDGLTDFAEVKNTLTDPNVPDTDGDGLKDGEEINTYLTDPLAADSDGDELSDGDEISRYSTDPNLNDTDSDNLADGAEVLEYNTDPNVADTDADELTDGAEVMDHKTNPLIADTDGGFVKDGIEVTRGTNPLAAEDDIAIPADFLFNLGSAKILPAAEENLKTVYEILIQYPEVRVEVVGHTCELGSESFNMELSLKRAQAVKDWLVGQNIEPERLIVNGYGEAKPVASNDTEEGRQQNRRIEFLRADIQ